MKKRKNKKTALILVLILLISVGYAALASNLKINGSSNVKASSWNVYWDNVQINENSVPADDNHKARITDSAKTQVEFSVVLSEPGDFYEFTVDAVNNGTIDAMIASQGIVNGVYSDSSYTTPATLPDAVSYTVTYADGSEIQEKHLLAKKNGSTPTKETYKVRIEYRNDENINPSDLDDTDKTFYFKFSVNYVQADGNATESHLVPRTLSIGDTVNYVTSLNGVTLDDWSVFYVDGDYTYLILDDYLPNAAVSNDVRTTYNLANGEGTYSIKSTTNRTDLINAMTIKANWDSLLTGSINGHTVGETRTENVWAMGSPTVDLWVNSWISKYPSDIVYIRYIDTEDIDNNNFYSIGYAIGNSQNPTTDNVDLSSKTGYNNTLYFPHQETIDKCSGYFLASPSAYTENHVLSESNSGTIFSFRTFKGDTMAFRPVIKLPTSIVNQ